MMNRSVIYILGMAIMAYACSPSTTGGSTSNKRKKQADDAYYEDLSALRPDYELPTEDSDNTVVIKNENITYPEPSNDITAPLTITLDSIDRLRDNINFVDGYTIQVYSGTSSADAKLTRGKLKSIDADFRASLKYEEPNFKVKVGQFYTRLEAQDMYSRIREHFPKSIIIPERIYLKSLD